jgi:hypothetical protein
MSNMSERERRDHARQSARDDRIEGVLAADDTGMVRNEADIVSANMQETELPTELPSDRGGTPDTPGPPV